MKLLLTGASGFVGRNVVLQALSQDLFSEIHLPVRNPEKLRAVLREDGVEEDPRLKFHQAEAPDWGLQEVPPVDAVVHAAGILFARNEDAYYRTNVEGTLKLLAQVPDSARVVVLSSQAAAGPCRDGCEAIVEGEEPPPLTLYGQSKRRMEEEVLKAYPERRILFVRPPMILGPRDAATLPLFKMARGPLMVKPGVGSKTYSFISVLDLAEAILHALTFPKDWKSLSTHAYFLCHPVPMRDSELMRGLQNAAGTRRPILPLPHALIRLTSWIVDAIPSLRALQPALTRDRVQDLYEDRWVISPARFQRDFEWTATRSLQQTLQEADAWLRAHGKL